MSCGDVIGLIIIAPIGFIFWLGIVFLGIAFCKEMWRKIYEL